jgi:hypothetical protein
VLDGFAGAFDGLAGAFADVLDRGTGPLADVLDGRTDALAELADSLPCTAANVLDGRTDALSDALEYLWISVDGGQYAIHDPRDVVEPHLEQRLRLYALDLEPHSANEDVCSNIQLQEIQHLGLERIRARSSSTSKVISSTFRTGTSSKTSGSSLSESRSART